MSDPTPFAREPSPAEMTSLPPPVCPNPQAATLFQQEMKRTAMTMADQKKAQAEQQQALEAEQMLNRLEERRITPTRELPKMAFLFRLFHKPCFPVASWWH